MSNPKLIERFKLSEYPDKMTPALIERILRDHKQVYGDTIVYGNNQYKERDEIIDYHKIINGEIPGWAHEFIRGYMRKDNPVDYLKYVNLAHKFEGK